MRYTPKINKNIATAIILFLVTASLVFGGCSFVINNISSNILKIASLLFFMTAVLTATHLVICSYTYILDDFEFIIVQKIGKTVKTVCRLYYTDITLVLPLNDAKDKLKGRIQHNYRVTMLPQKTYCLFYEFENESGVIFFEPNDDFTLLLKKHLQDDILND